MSKNPREISDSLRDIGHEKVTLPVDKMFILAVLAGAYIGFGAQLSMTVGIGLDTSLGIGFSRFLQGSAFSLGLILVVIGGAELFTGNNLILLSFFDKKIDLSGLLRSWTVVYVGNFIGSVLLVSIVFGGGLHAIGGGALGVEALTIANGKVNLTFVQALCRGIVCNWLVCMAIWLSMSSKETIGKIFACFFPIMAFVASGYEHSIANMYFVPMGILMKGVPSVVAQSGLELTKLSWAGFLINNLIPVTIGNIIGGAFFVAALYWYVYLRK